MKRSTRTLPVPKISRSRPPVEDVASPRVTIPDASECRSILQNGLGKLRFQDLIPPAKYLDAHVESPENPSRDKRARKDDQEREKIRNLCETDESRRQLPEGKSEHLEIYKQVMGGQTFAQPCTYEVFFSYNNPPPGTAEGESLAEAVGRFRTCMMEFVPVVGVYSVVSGQIGSVTDDEHLIKRMQQLTLMRHPIAPGDENSDFLEEKGIVKRREYVFYFNEFPMKEELSQDPVETNIGQKLANANIPLFSHHIRQDKRGEERQSKLNHEENPYAILPGQLMTVIPAKSSFDTELVFKVTNHFETDNPAHCAVSVVYYKEEKRGDEQGYVFNYEIPARFEQTNKFAAYVFASTQLAMEYGLGRLPGRYQPDA